MRVIKGTPIHGESLCLTCKYGTVIEGQAMSQRILYCGDTGRFIKFEVSRCSAYVAQGTLSLWQLTGMAKIIEIDTKGEIGFRALTNDERHELRDVNRDE